ncbi:MAG: glycoside hydrolase family 31 [Herbinix sp.]|nr:glycoside hydrolase family 31 [Herbinix sp.]
MRYEINGNRLICYQGEAVLWIEPWGENSLRVRMTKEAFMDQKDWALTEQIIPINAEIAIEDVEVLEPWYRTNPERHIQKVTVASIRNGKITAKFNIEGWLSFENEKGEILTQEYWRNRARIDRYAVPLGVSARELKPITGTSDYRLTDPLWYPVAVMDICGIIQQLEQQVLEQIRQSGLLRIPRRWTTG